LPEVLVSLREEVPDLKLTLLESEPSDVNGLITSQKVDIGVTVLHGRFAEGLRSESLLELPLALHVAEDANAGELEDLLVDDDWEKGKVGRLPLVGLPPHEILNKLVQEEFGRRKIDWPVTVEVSSLDTILEYVSRGFGVGIGLSVPGEKLPKGVRSVPLSDFEPLVLGAVWQGQLKPVAAAFLEAARGRAGTLKLNH
jgi:DNA-binding transcriptional LysR family regulator